MTPSPSKSPTKGAAWPTSVSITLPAASSRFGGSARWLTWAAPLPSTPPSLQGCHGHHLCRNSRSIHRAHAEVEITKSVTFGVSDREGKVETEGNGSQLGDLHAQAGADRGTDFVETVIAFDRAEIGEDDLLEDIAGAEGKLVLDRAQRHHDAADRYAQGVRADGAVLEAAKATEVAGEVAFVHRNPLGRDTEVAPQGEEPLSGPVRAAAGSEVRSPLGVELGPGECAPALLERELGVLTLGGHERVVPVVEPYAGTKRGQERLSSSRQVRRRSRSPEAVEVDVLDAQGRIGVDARAKLASQREPGTAAPLVPVGIKSVEPVGRHARTDGQVEEVRLAQADLEPVDVGARLDVDAKLLAGAPKGRAVEDVVERAREVPDVKILLVNGEVTEEALKAAGGHADHESARGRFIDGSHDVGERAIGKGIVPVGPDVGHVQPGHAGERTGQFSCAHGRRAGRPGRRRGWRRAGSSRGRHDQGRRRVRWRTEQVVRAERGRGRRSGPRFQPRHIVRRSDRFGGRYQLHT